MLRLSGALRCVVHSTFVEFRFSHHSFGGCHSHKVDSEVPPKVVQKPTRRPKTSVRRDRGWIEQVCCDVSWYPYAVPTFILSVLFSLWLLGKTLQHPMRANVPPLFGSGAASCALHVLQHDFDCLLVVFHSAAVRSRHSDHKLPLHGKTCTLSMLPVNVLD